MFLRECILKDFFYFNDSTYLNEERKKNKNKTALLPLYKLRKSGWIWSLGLSLLGKRAINFYLR